MSIITVPTGARDLTAAWVTSALAERYAARVTSLTGESIGTGQVADSVRLRLQWDPPDAGPATLVVKVTSASEVSRATALATRTYEVEVGFYTELAPTLPVRAPRCYWTGYDPSSAAYAVVLEDLAPAVPGDQIAGCSVDQAAQALEELTLLHGSRWGDPSLATLVWLDRRSGDDSGVASAVAAMAGGFLDRYASRLEPEVVELIQRFVPQVARYGRAGDGPATVVHGDFRTDNLMFGVDGGERVGVLDWQTVSRGPALSDVSYFLGGSLLPDDRRVHERDLVRGYWERLAGSGGTLTWDEAWTGYRRYAFGGLVMAIVASMLVVRTDRGDDMFIAMAERAGRHALDLDAERLLREQV